MQTPNKQTGFTIIELMIVIAIVGTMMAIALPSFNSFIANQRVKSAAQTMYTTFTYARAEAIKRNDNVFIVADDGNNWQDGWAISTVATRTFAECNVATAPGDCLKIQQAIPNITIANTGITRINFLRTGRPAAGQALAGVNLCNAESLPGVKMRVVTLGLTGLPNIDLGGNCP